MITDEDIKKLSGEFATKEDLKGFATKEDLLNTKFELENRIDKLEENMATKDELRKVMTVLDKVLKEVLAMRQEQTLHTGDHMRINERLATIEQTPTMFHEIRQSKV